MNALQRGFIGGIARLQPATADAWALARVRAMGKWVVDRDDALPAPEVGSVWVPRRTEALTRHVKDAWEFGRIDFFDYPEAFLGHYRERHCTLATWHRWIRRTRAVRSDQSSSGETS